MDKKNSTSKKKKIKVYTPLILAIALILGGGIYWYKQYSRFIKTDDAYIDADNISISSKMLGRITQTFAAEGDLVSRGDLLAVLDSSDLIAQKLQRIATYKQAQANLVQAQARYTYNKESIKVLEVNLHKAQSDLKRAQEQFEGGVITQEQIDHITQAYDVAQASLNAAKTQLKVASAQIGTAKAAIETALAQIAVIEASLEHTRLYSPITGVIAKRWLLPNDVVQPSQLVYTVTNPQKHWVMVYLEETKIAEVHPDQPVRFTIDAFPKVSFFGKVFYIGANTASQFSLIPPNNASGNFTKITQRIPVKVSIDGTKSGKDIDSFNILAGMSAIVNIIKE